MMTWWREIAIAVLAVACMWLFDAWRGIADDFAEYRGRIAQAGEQAQRVADQINERHKKTLEDVSNAWQSQLKPTQDNAVAAYRRHHPPGSVQPNPCIRPMPEPSISPEISDGTVAERMAAGPACEPDAGFIQASAQDALKLRMWRMFAINNKLPIAEYYDQP